MRLIAIVSAALACASALQFDTDLGKILETDASYKGIKFFWIRDHAKEQMKKGAGMSQVNLFTKLLTLVDEYATSIKAKHLPTSEKVKILHGMIEFKTKPDGQALYQHALKAIRDSDKTRHVPASFFRCSSNMTGKAADKDDATRGYKLCVGTSAGTAYPGFSLTEINAMANEVLYTVYLKRALAQHGLDAILLQQCEVGSNRTTTWYDGKSYNDYVLEAASKAAADAKCTHKVSGNIAAKVVAMVKDADDETLSALHISFIKEHPKDSDALGTPVAWTVKKCGSKAVQWFVRKLIAVEAGGCAGIVVPPSTEAVPPSLEDVLSVKAFADEKVERSAPWATVVFGGCVGASATLAAFALLRRRSVTAEE